MKVRSKEYLDLCDECGKAAPVFLILGDKRGAGLLRDKIGSIIICPDCLKKGLKMIKKAEGEK